MFKQKAGAAKRMSSNGKWQSVLFQISIYAIPLTLFVVFWVGINVNSLIMAFQKISFEGERSFAGFSNFKNFVDKVFARNNSGTLLQTSFKNSFKMFFINFLFSMPLYLLFSFYLFKKLPGNKAFLIIVMIPSIVSEFIISLVFKRFVNVVLPKVFNIYFHTQIPSLLEHPSYTFGTTLFFMIWVSFSTSLIVYPNAMRAISGEIIESSHIDGAGMWKEFWHIILPLISPTLSTFIITGVAGIFLAAGPAVAFYQFNAYPEVYTVGYYYTAMVMNATNETGYPEMAAGGLILTAISCPMTFGVKYFLEKILPETN